MITSKHCGGQAYYAGLVFLVILMSVGFSSAQNAANTARSSIGQSILDTTPDRGLSSAQVAATRRTLDEETMFGVPSPADDDIGVQQIFKRTERWQPFTAFAEVSAYHTSNAFLNEIFKLDDAYMVGRIGAGYQQRISGPLFFDLSLRQQIFRYDRYDELDFESLRAESSLIYILPPMPDTSIFVRYAYERLTDGRDHNEFFTNHGLTTGIQKVIPFSRAHRVMLGLSAEFSLDTEPETIQRNEYALYAAYSVDITRNLKAMLTYRGSFQDYTEFDREDWNHLGDFNLQYQITKNIICSASLTCTTNESSFEVFDYDVLNVGGGLALLIRF